MHVFKITHRNAAFICSTMWLGLALSSPFLGWISTHFKSRVWPLSISALIGSLAFIILLIFPHLSSLELIVLLLLAGAACSGQALSFTVVKEINPEHRRATAIAFNNMAVVISGAIFQPLIGKLLDFHCQFGDTAILSSCETLHHRLSMIPIVGAFVLSFIIAAFFIKESWQH
jgi:MFS family permease